MAPLIAMNEIRLSGVLREVREHHASGKPFLTAMLEFRPHQKILLVGVDGGRRALEPFDSNDPVRVTGRIAVFKNSLCVLVDQIDFHAIAADRKRSTYQAGTDKNMRELESAL